MTLTASVHQQALGLTDGRGSTFTRVPFRWNSAQYAYGIVRRISIEDPLSGTRCPGQVLLGRSVQISSGVDATQDSCQARPDSAHLAERVPAYFATGRARNNTEEINGIIELGRCVARGFTNPRNFRLRNDPGCRTAHPAPNLR